MFPNPFALPPLMPPMSSSLRPPFAMLVCCSLIGALGTAPAVAQNRLPPLTVDPQLLGLPAPAPTGSGTGAADRKRAAQENAEDPGAKGVEVRAVTAPRVEPLTSPKTDSASGNGKADRGGKPEKGDKEDRRSTKNVESRTANPADKPAGTKATVPVEAREPAAPVTSEARLRADPRVAPRQSEAVVDPLVRVEPPSRQGLMTLGRRSGKGNDGPAGAPGTVYLWADRMDGDTNLKSVASGNAKLLKDGTLLTSDKLTYLHVEDEAEAEGNVVLSQESGVVTGPRMQMVLGEQTGYFEQPKYVFEQQRTAVTTEDNRAVVSRGEADRIDFEGQDHYRLTNATYSTCPADATDWFAKVANLKLDYEREVGEGEDGTVYFKGIPILYSPNLSFSLDNQRKSGLLAPTFGSSTKSGLDLSVPYYWNIAPNYDATITPRLMSKRGVQLKSEFRYLDTNYSGITRFDYLPNDSERHENRYAYSVLHQQTLGYGLSAMVNVQGVSDDYYYTDLASRFAITSQTYLPRQLALDFGAGWISAQAQVLRYQTLQPSGELTVGRPYSLMPQFTLNARQPDLFGTDVALAASYTDFRHNYLDEGRRVVVYPQISLPIQSAGWYITPKVGAHFSEYQITRHETTGPDSISRSLPIFSLDSGMTFERETNLFGSKVVQTLEPRLFYVYTPYRDQSQIPLFDTGLGDFNFAQVFSENLFVGSDRIADANQLTAAVTSRLIHPDTGAEIIKGVVGQRFYFSDQQVTLNAGDPKRTAKRADWLMAVTGNVAPKTYIDTGWQYNPRDQQTERFSFMSRYQPESGKVLLAGYRFNREVIAPFNTATKQVDVSAQWPISGPWYAIGRYNYSLADHRLVEGVAGVEYNGGCWVVRSVVQRLAVTADSPNTAFFVQLELNDFANIGSNPLGLLRRTVPGYTKVNELGGTTITGAMNDDE